MTLQELKRRAKSLGLMIRRDGHGNFILTDAATNTVAAYPATMSLDQIEEWLNDYEAIFDNDSLN